MVRPNTEFRATIESYSGPLDLLLYLIKKDEVDIFDIPIAAIIEQYQAHLEILRDLDPNACGEFLVMAANLMEIKSRLLLPREVLEDDGEELEDPRMELVRQLLEYKKFKERAILLEKQLEQHSRRFRRPPPTLAKAAEELTSPLPLGNIDVWDLLTAFHRIQIALGQRLPVHVLLEDRPVGEYMDEIRVQLRERESRSAVFEDLFTGARSRQEVIGYLLAILELAKQYEILVTQDEPNGAITVSLRDEDEVRRLQAEATADVEQQPAAAHLIQGEGHEAALESEPESELDSEFESETDEEDEENDEHTARGPGVDE
jgi:segregation and condensation protein A